MYIYPVCIYIYIIHVCKYTHYEMYYMVYTIFNMFNRIIIVSVVPPDDEPPSECHVRTELLLFPLLGQCWVNSIYHRNLIYDKSHRSMVNPMDPCESMGNPMRIAI